MHPDSKSAGFFDNPYPHYQALRASGKPVWYSYAQRDATEGMWLVSRYRDALRLLKAPRLLSSEIAKLRCPGTVTPMDLHMLVRGGGDHLRLRRLVDDYFTSQAVGRFEPLVEEIAKELIQGLAASGPIDLVAEYAELLPLHVIAEFMGVPRADMSQLRAWAMVIGDGYDSMRGLPGDRERFSQAMQELLQYVEKLIEDNSEADSDSLLAYLISAQQAGEMSRDELIGMVAFLLLAGHETTISLIGNGVWLLLSHPEQWQMLQRQPELLPSAVEEILRYESPLQRTVFRITNEQIDINGVSIGPGQQISILIGAANRDETEFADAERFDIRRTPNRHLAFGLGLHNCLGKTLARVEGKVALRMLLKHFPALRLEADQPQWRKNSLFRRLANLQVSGT